MKRPVVKLVGHDGNAFAIIAACQKAALKAKWTPDQWNKVQAEMMAGNYNTLLQVALKHFDVR